MDLHSRTLLTVRKVSGWTGTNIQTNEEVGIKLVSTSPANVVDWAELGWARLGIVYCNLCNLVCVNSLHELCVLQKLEVPLNEWK